MTLAENVAVPLEYVTHRRSLHLADVRGEALAILAEMGLAAKADVLGRHALAGRAAQAGAGACAGVATLPADPRRGDGRIVRARSRRDARDRPARQPAWRHHHHDRAHHARDHALLRARRVPGRRTDPGRGHAGRRWPPTPVCAGSTSVLRLTVDNLEAGYGAVRALHGVSLQVSQGETVALLGTNGNGKSTLMKCIMGLVSPSSGTVALELDGERIDLTGKPPQEIVALGIALVPEGRRLFPKLTVEENLLLGAFRARCPSRDPAQPRAVLRGVSGAAGARPPARREHERRPAADAGDRACDHVGAAHAARRRAVGRAVAGAGDPDHQHHPPAQGSSSG